MSTPVLVTKLFIPPPRAGVVVRPRLIARLDEGLHRMPGVTLISAPAGFGKTTLVGTWITGCGRPAAWLSLDEGDNDPARFLTYLVAAVQTIAGHVGRGMVGVLQAPQPPPMESLLTALLNEIAALPGKFILVLDDYHVVDARPAGDALGFMITHLPAQLHLVIATREDPPLPLSRLRARGHLTELRAADLRFTAPEAAEFLNRTMGLNLAADAIATLETRAEGWIAGLQLAAISLQGQRDAARLIQSFTGSHRFVMDYLVEEVLHQQPANVQSFLLRTSILDRLCGPLCDAVLLEPATSGQETLDYLDRANLFIVPMDNERRWYRYHHLFADLLRHRLLQTTGRPAGGVGHGTEELHQRASQWYEDNGQELEAFHHAAAANDIDRAERLIMGKDVPLHSRGAVAAIVSWLDSLPETVLHARPSLRWAHAAMLLISGQTAGVGEKLHAAEAALHGTEADDTARHLIGRVAAARATLALTRYDVDTMIDQSHRALEYLPADGRSLRANANWTLGYARLLAGDRAAARRSLTDAVTLSQATGAIFTTILATLGLGNVQELDNQLHAAAETYRRVLHLAGDQPLQIIHEAHLGLARVLYEWNDLDAAEEHGRQSLHLARQYESVIDRYIICEIFLARLHLARGDVAGAAAMLAQAGQSASERGFARRLPEIAAAQVPVLLRQGDATAAAHLARLHKLPLGQARIHLALGDTAAALAVLEPWRRQVAAKGWADERLKAMILQAIALDAHGDEVQAVQLLGDALALAEAGGLIRAFADEGATMARLLAGADRRRMAPAYVDRLLAALVAGQGASTDSFPPRPHPLPRSLPEPISQRELEVLRLIAQGLSNREIGERLFLALDTVKGHNQRIFGKLQAQRRTEAVARARELGLL